MVYLTLDSLFDYRQGLICKLITDASEPLENRLVTAANLWVKHLEKRYDGRRMDDYTFPALNLTNEKFQEAYENRSLDDFKFYTPSNISKILLQSVMQVETNYDQLTSIRSFNLTINMFPYVLDEELQQILKDSINQRFRGRHEITLIYKDDRKATPSFYRSFDYVFKYDLLLSKDYKSFFDNLKKEPIPDVVFFVPAILFKNEEYITGKPEQVIEAFATTTVNQIALVPIPPVGYDHQ